MNFLKILIFDKKNRWGNFENINIGIDIDKDNLKNIVIDIDIDMVILENIDIDIDINMDFLKDIDINKGILQNIDIDRIFYWLEFGISNRARWWKWQCTHG